MPGRFSANVVADLEFRVPATALARASINGLGAFSLSEPSSSSEGQAAGALQQLLPLLCSAARWVKVFAHVYQIGIDIILRMYF
jgi:hypothetical protein